MPAKYSRKAGKELRDLRRSLGLSQRIFWAMVGVTQSGGCRYEYGRRVPKPTSEMVRIVHIVGISSEKITRKFVEAMQVGQKLLRIDRRLYENLARLNSHRKEPIIK